MSQHHQSQQSQQRCTQSMILAAAGAIVFSACPNVENPNPPDNEQEVITTVTLSFAPAGGASTVVAEHADPENDGDPSIDAITLTAGTSYTLTVEFLNELEDPPENITSEVSEESAEHQVFVYGSGVQGPATGPNAAHLVTHAYADQDEHALPIGLENTIEAVTAGSAELKLMLRHLPPEDGSAVKTAGLAEELANGGSAAMPGEIDADVTFPLRVE